MATPSAMSSGDRQGKASGASSRVRCWRFSRRPRYPQKSRHTPTSRRDSRAMSQAMPSETPPPNDAAFADPALRRALADFVRRRVPPSDVDDVVQTVLCDALTAPGRPRDAEGLRRWLLGIARHKVVDLHRRARREPPTELPEIAEAPPPIEARELVGWA